MSKPTPIFTEQVEWYSPQTPPDTTRDLMLLMESDTGRVPAFGYFYDGKYRAHNMGSALWRVAGWAELPRGSESAK